jgi:hypothetical protein
LVLSLLSCALKIVDGIRIEMLKHFTNDYTNHNIGKTLFHLDSELSLIK